MKKFCSAILFANFIYQFYKPIILYYPINLILFSNILNGFLLKLVLIQKIFLHLFLFLLLTLIKLQYEIIILQDCPFFLYKILYPEKWHMSHPRRSTQSKPKNRKISSNGMISKTDFSLFCGQILVGLNISPILVSSSSVVKDDRSRLKTICRTQNIRTMTKFYPQMKSQLTGL